MNNINQKGIFVYKLITPSGKVLVGSSNNLASKISYHLANLSNNDHCSSSLQQEWNKYGGNDFRYEIYKECKTREDAYLEVEQLIRELLKADPGSLLNPIQYAPVCKGSELVSSNRERGYQLQSEAMKKRHKDNPVARLKQSIATIKKNNTWYLIKERSGKLIVTDSYHKLCENHELYTAQGFYNVLQRRTYQHKGAYIEKIPANEGNRVEGITYVLFIEILEKEIENIISQKVLYD